MILWFLYKTVSSSSFLSYNNGNQYCRLGDWKPLQIFIFNVKRGRSVNAGFHSKEKYLLQSNKQEIKASKKFRCSTVAKQLYLDQQRKKKGMRGEGVVEAIFVLPLTNFDIHYYGSTVFSCADWDLYISIRYKKNHLFRVMCDHLSFLNEMD